MIKRSRDKALTKKLKTISDTPPVIEFSERFKGKIQHVSK